MNYIKYKTNVQNVSTLTPRPTPRPISMWPGLFVSQRASPALHIDDRTQQHHNRIYSSLMLKNKETPNSWVEVGMTLTLEWCRKYVLYTYLQLYKAKHLST